MHAVQVKARSRTCKVPALHAHVGQACNARSVVGAGDTAPCARGLRLLPPHTPSRRPSHGLRQGSGRAEPGRRPARRGGMARSGISNLGSVHRICARMHEWIARGQSQSNTRASTSQSMRVRTHARALYFHGAPCWRPNNQPHHGATAGSRPQESRIETTCVVELAKLPIHTVDLAVPATLFLKVVLTIVTQTSRAKVIEIA